MECRTCNREVAGSNLGRGCFAPKSTQPSIPLGSVNEYQLRLGRQRQVWFIPFADKTRGMQVKLCYPLTVRAIPERFRDASCGGAQIKVTQGHWNGHWFHNIWQKYTIRHLKQNVLLLTTQVVVLFTVWKIILILFSTHSDELQRKHNSKRCNI